MDISLIIDFLLHIDKYLSPIIQQYGSWVYAFLFLIIFCETGLVITPFLPGDSLIFVAGTFASQGSLNVLILFTAVAVAAILGDTVNYFIGKYFGERIEKRGWIKSSHLEKTQRFYEKHGGKTIVLARFMPIIRTIAPFVAGVGKMNYTRFLSYNIFGGIFWSALCTFGGYYFGTVPWVENNLTLVIIIIVATSFIPPVWEFAKSRFSKKSSQENPQQSPQWNHQQNISNQGPKSIID